MSLKQLLDGVATGGSGVCSIVLDATGSEVASAGGSLEGAAPLAQIHLRGLRRAMIEALGHGPRRLTIAGTERILDLSALAQDCLLVVSRPAGPAGRDWESAFEELSLRLDRELCG